jgi:alkylated DNA repair dioxygenase AlkB
MARSASGQPELFDEVPALPPGFEYAPGFLDEHDAEELTTCVAAIEFSTFQMHGVTARRRTAHYGWNYTYDSRSGEPGRPIPGFLLPVRTRLAEWASIRPETFEEALVTEYAPGAGIGWHRDAPMFGAIIAGLSLGAPARMRFRPYERPADRSTGSAPRRATHEIMLEPGSAYLITGTARSDYEHGIPPVDGQRYSITFRTVRRTSKG